MRRRRSMKRRSMRRRFRRTYARKRFATVKRLSYARPEVKYTVLNAYVESTFFNWNRTTATTQLGLTGGQNDYCQIITWPSQGTSDTTRIGDTIRPIRLWIKYQLALTSSYKGCLVRVILFTLNTINNNGATQTFWQTAINSPIMGVPDREIVRNVLYDKIHTMNANIDGVITYFKSHDINIRLSRPVVFVGGGTVPKNPADVIYMAILPALINNVSASVALVWANVTSRFYFYDN